MKDCPDNVPDIKKMTAALNFEAAVFLPAFYHEDKTVSLLIAL